MIDDTTSAAEPPPGEWVAVMGSNPSADPEQACDRYGNEAPPSPSGPVCCVSWYEADTFARRASARDAVMYRLPTEEEWEYAARGDQPFVYAGSNDPVAVGWVEDNSNSQTHAVCEKARNAFGLCDMTGNVWEWVSDRYDSYPGGRRTDLWGLLSGEPVIIRGGGCIGAPAVARVARRFWRGPESGTDFLGLRLVRANRHRARFRSARGGVAARVERSGRAVGHAGAQRSKGVGRRDRRSAR